MDKTELVTRVSCLLNRGTVTEADTICFQERKHDDLVLDFQHFLELHPDFLGRPQFEHTHSPNDRGTDLLLISPAGKIGFQIKNQSDVANDNFSTTVKAQLSDSFSHGLLKWYLLICCPWEVPGKKPGDPATKFGLRIRHLLNDLSSHQSSYAACYSPSNCVRYFGVHEPIDGVELNSQFHRWNYSSDDPTILLRELASPKAPPNSGIIDPPTPKVKILFGEISYVRHSSSTPSHWKFTLGIYVRPVSNARLAFPFHKCSAVLVAANKTISDDFIMMLDTTAGKQRSLGRLVKTTYGKVWRRPQGMIVAGDYRPPGGSELNITGPVQVEIDGNANSDVYDEYPELQFSVTLIEAVTESKIVLTDTFKQQKTKEGDLVWVWPNEKKWPSRP